MLSIIFREYFFLRQRIPIFLYVFYIHFRDLDNPLIDRIIITLLTFMGLISAYTFSAFILKIPFSDMIPFTWTYYGLIHWCIFFFFFFHIANRKGMNSLKSFTLATLATVGGGWLYEVPFFYPESMFISRLSIFYINTQIVCLLCLLYEFMKMKFRPNKIILTMLMIFLAFSSFLFFRKVDPISENIINSFLINNIWFYRTPASLLLISLLSGVKNQNEMMKNV